MIFQFIIGFFGWLAIFGLIIIAFGALGGDPTAIFILLCLICLMVGGFIFLFLRDKYRDNILRKAKKAWGNLSETEKNAWENADIYRKMIGASNSVLETGMRAFMICYFVKAGLLDWFRKDGLKVNPRIPEGKKKFIKDTPYRNFDSYIENVGINDKKC